MRIAADRPLLLEMNAAGRYVAAYANCGAAMRRDVYLQLAGFPAFFGHMYEEPDYALQCYAAGLAVWFEPDLAVRHHMSSVNRHEGRRQRLHARNELWSVLIRCPWPYLPAVALFRIWRQLRYAATQGPSDVLLQPAWWLSALRGLPQCLATRTAHPVADLLGLDEAREEPGRSTARAGQGDGRAAMRFHALLPVRDEADIIGQCLRHLLTWADAVYVFDTGSVDDTWDIVRDVASRDDRVRLLGRDPVYFSETRLRGWMFHQARAHMRDGDWFLRVDADEFHHVPPPEFVRTRLAPHETIVFHQYYDFRLTAAEVAAWQAGRETLADRARPIEERRRFFTVSAYSEPRLCRYRATMRWPPTVSFPFNAGFRARARLPIRHYPHRDPVQLERRCRLRAAMMADAENRRHWSRPDAHHWSQSDWQSFIVPDDHPDLHYWQPGSPVARVPLHQPPRETARPRRAAHRPRLPPAGTRPPAPSVPRCHLTLNALHHALCLDSLMSCLKVDGQLLNPRRRSLAEAEIVQESIDAIPNSTVI